MGSGGHSREADKEISLRSDVCQGCIVFVRLLQPLANSNNSPIAFSALKVMERAEDGRIRVRLAQLRPRSTLKETAKLPSDSTILVA